MRVSRDIDLVDLEKLLVVDLDDELILSQAHKKSNLGFLSRFLQFLITLAKRNTSLAVYYPHLGYEDQDALEGLVSDPMALIPILMAKETFVRGHLPIKRDLNQRLVNRFNQSKFYSYKRYLQLIAVDHSIEKYAYPESMYRVHGGETTYELKTSSHFDTVLQDYLKNTFKVSSLDGYEIAGLGELLHELLLNTEEHAKSDYKSGVSERSVRGGILNSVSINTDQELSTMAPDGTPIFSYLTSLRNKSERAIHVLEISVFDSGPGIAKSFSREEISFKDEVGVFAKSFKKGVTSKVNGVGMGRGLPKSIKIINGRKGYLSIRSGRLSVYRDFRRAPIGFYEGDLEGDITYMDEIAEDAAVYSEMASVEGTAYTILVPVK